MKCQKILQCGEKVKKKNGEEPKNVEMWRKMYVNNVCEQYFSYPYYLNTQQRYLHIKS